MATAAIKQQVKSRAKPARDFDEDMRNAMHISEEGWQGIPAGAFRNAMISVCRLVDFKMNIAKLPLYSSNTTITDRMPET